MMGRLARIVAALALAACASAELPFDFLYSPATSYRTNYPHVYEALLQRQGHSTGRVVEVGVATGIHAQGALDRASANIEQLYLVDPTILPQLADRLKKWPMEFNATKVTMFKDTSLSAVHNIPDNSVDWIYIDGVHTYDSVRANCRAWWPKLKIGGLFSGHDYCNSRMEVRGQHSNVPWCGRYINGTRAGSEKQSQMGSYRAANEFTRDYNLQVS
ncbi:hypothetical protein M885DRAFT_624025 [Pelagophyceae sp. CCMP2097]|nr:hypothetical protein M885DRAFT_624025 [Pelagophyceae sp. CCMP2097]